MDNTGPQNSIPGTDESLGTALPQTQIDDVMLAEERSMARFSKTKEYKRLKEYMEGRIEFFQKYLPDGRPLKTDTVNDKDWIVANTVIGEFKALLAAYEDAQAAVRQNG